MKTDILKFIDRYVKDLKNGNAAIFAGAGLSMASGFVNWKGLLEGIAEELELDIDRENDLIALAQYYENYKGGRGSINTQLVEEFTKEVQLTENHDILAQLPIETYWTTNYDDLIEKALEKNGKIVDRKLCPQNLAINKPNRDAIVYKMHGDILLPHEAVITKDDYESYNEKRQVFTTALQGDLISKTFLFIGFSFDDPNLEHILGRIRILLGNSMRDHYCFLKKVNRNDYNTDEEYAYAKVKQELKIKDLKRYRIQALVIDDFKEITDTLKYIQIKTKRSNIFISGAASEYGEFDRQRTEGLVYHLAKEIAKSNNKIISGFGLGIGSSVINGVVSWVEENAKDKLDEYLMLKPFPQNIENEEERKKAFTNYRKRILKDAGIAIFLVGNKLDHKTNQIVTSDGMQEEFKIAKENGIKIIPIACTGYLAKEIWEEVLKDSEKFYKNDMDVLNYIKNLDDLSKTNEEIIKNIMSIIKLIQKR